MSSNAGAAVIALFIAGFLAAALSLIPIAFVMGHFLLIWPLVGSVDALDLVDLGKAINGFFVPNFAGATLVAAVIWLILFLIIRPHRRQE